MTFKELGRKSLRCTEGEPLCIDILLLALESTGVETGVLANGEPFCVGLPLLLPVVGSTWLGEMALGDEGLPCDGDGDGGPLCPEEPPPPPSGDELPMTIVPEEPLPMSTPFALPLSPLPTLVSLLPDPLSILPRARGVWISELCSSSGATWSGPDES